MLRTLFVYILVIIAFINLHSCTELTFELPDSARECFHEEIKKNTSATLEFQVTTCFALPTIIVNSNIIFNRWSPAVSMM